MKSLRISSENPIQFGGGAQLRALLGGLPNLSQNPKVALTTISEYLRDRGFSYVEGTALLADVLKSKAGSCLGLSVLVTAILLEKGRSPECKILIHPRDAVDQADRNLFANLMCGEYFDYESPQLPQVADQPTTIERIHRFVPLGHPIVVLEKVPLETTLIADADADPLVEFAAESSLPISSEILASYLLSDQAKMLFASLGSERALSKGAVQDFDYVIQRSLEIFPENRDALVLQWNCGRLQNNEILQIEAKSRLLDLGPVDSDLSYKLWTVTGEVEYLDTTLHQFPEHIPAFLDRKVFQEPDPREARMNLAVALWCIAYSSTFDLTTFYRDEQIKRKIAQLFPKRRVA